MIDMAAAVSLLNTLWDRIKGSCNKLKLTVDFNGQKFTMNVVADMRKTEAIMSLDF